MSIMIDFFLNYKPIIIILHALAAAGGLGAVLITDTLFFQFLKDFKISTKEDETMRTISRVVWVVILFLFLTGLALFLSEPIGYLAKSKFIVKLVIFGMIILNGLLLNNVITPVLRCIPFGPSSVPLKPRIKFLRALAFASGAISMVSWISVFLLGSIRSIPVGVGTGLVIYGGLILVAIIGSQIYAHILAHPLKSTSSRG